jgi:hypothetical protein
MSTSNMSASASTSTQTGGPSPSISSATTSPTLPHSPETQRQIAEARAALEASMHNIGSSLDTSLRSRAQNLHANSAQLEKQQKDVVKATEALRKENDKLKKLADEGSRKVKELGNVQNWAEMLERDFLVLQETVRLANGDSESSWDTESEYSDSGSERGDRDGSKADGAQTEPRKVLDQEGDTKMEDFEPEVKGKGKEKGSDVNSQEVVPEPVGGSSSGTTGSISAPSSTSVHTGASDMS